MYWESFRLGLRDYFFIEYLETCQFFRPHRLYRQQSSILFTHPLIRFQSCLPDDILTCFQILRLDAFVYRKRKRNFFLLLFIPVLFTSMQNTIHASSGYPYLNPTHVRACLPHTRRISVRRKISLHTFVYVRREICYTQAHNLQFFLRTKIFDIFYVLPLSLINLYKITFIKEFSIYFIQTPDKVNINDIEPEIL